MAKIVEYKIEKMSSNYWEEMLNDYAKKGWELVQIVPVSTGWYYLIFKK